LLANPYSFGSYSYPKNCPKLLANVVKVPPRGFELPKIRCQERWTTTPSRLGFPGSSIRLRVEYFSSIPQSQRRFHPRASPLGSIGKLRLLKLHLKSTENFKVLYKSIVYLYYRLKKAQHFW